MKKKVSRLGMTSVQIRPQIAKMLARLLMQGLSKSEIINEALRQYLLEKELEESRQQLLPYAKAKGLYTDEDIERFFK